MQLSKIFPLFFFSLLLATISFAQETYPSNSLSNANHVYYAFTNATIHIDYQTEIKNATLLIQDGRIVEVSEKVKIPQGTVVQNLNGKHIYPSFIDMFTNYGMPEIKKTTATETPQYQSPIKGAFSWNQALKPEYDAYKNFAVDKKAAAEYRKIGFGTVVTMQRDGIARGSGTVVTLAEKKENEVVLIGKAVAGYSFDKGTSIQENPQSLMGSIALLRQAYLDAQWYKENQKKAEFNISLAAWNEQQTLPQVFEVKDKLSALRATKIAKEFNVKYIIKGTGDEYQRLDEIKNTFSPFIIPVNFPAAIDVEDPLDAVNVSLEELKHWELAPANLAYLQKYGITFSITAADLKDKNDFLTNIRKAIKIGLKEKDALMALTYTPAKLLGLQEEVGSLKEKMLANFIITDKNIFDEKSKIYQNWIQGESYSVNDSEHPEMNGRYNFELNGQTNYTLEITGRKGNYNYQLLKTGDTTKLKVTAKIDKSTILLTFSNKDEKDITRLSGTINAVNDSARSMSGTGQTVDGNWINWKASFKESIKKDEKTEDYVKPDSVLGKIIYPFCGYGEAIENKGAWKKFKERQHAILIKNVTVWTNEEQGILKNKDVYINSGRIVAIDDNILPLKTAYAKVIDGTGKHLTAGIIDEHSHIAISNGVNEGSQSVTAEVRMGDVLTGEDINIYRQLAGGVTAAQILHGSANVIGGQSALIKLRWGEAPEELKIYGADGFIKFALGENVKQSNWGDRYSTRFPQTRMGVEQVLYDAFNRAKEYETKMKTYEGLSKKEKANTPAPRRDLELEAVLEVLNNKRFITCHSYVQSEINMLMHVADSLGFKVNTFTHILEGYKVADKMKAHGAGASTFADWWAYKTEVKDAIPYNAALLTKMGIVTAINSDDAEMGRRLNQEAAKTIKYGGLSEEEALKLCTLNPAKLLHLDDKMGSIKIGKDGDVVLWSDNPLSVYAKVEKTIIDGIIYYDIEKDDKLRDYIQKERARIIQKMMAAKKGGEKTEKPTAKKPHQYHCEDIGE